MLPGAKALGFWNKRRMPALYRKGEWEALDAGYSGPDRAYHGWAHIVDLLSKNEKFRHLAVRPDLIVHAIFWHDVVYKTRKEDGTLRSDQENVQESADLFMCYSLLPNTDKQAVYAMIMATASHMNLPDVPEYYPGFYHDRNLFIDLDLSGLAGSVEEFDRAGDGVRYEYSWVPEKLFCAARSEILAGFARIQPTYKTPQLEKIWGVPARRNLIRSSRELAARAAAL